MVIHIKNMVCARCKMLVEKILHDIHLEYINVDLGVVNLKYPLAISQKDALRDILKVWDLVLIEDNNEILVEKIKNSVISLIRDDASSICTIKISHYLSRNLNYNYTYLANVFSQETGICLRDFIIAHKIEKVKEMMIYEELTVTEIAWKLNYSSVAHLSNQFHKITGFRPSQFKKNSGRLFIPLEQIGMREAV